MVSEIKGGRYAVRVGVGPCKVQVRMLKKVGEKKAYGERKPYDKKRY